MSRIPRTSVRCFRANRNDGGRCGVWIYTRPSGFRGVFFHGGREETQAPRYAVQDMPVFDHQEEITPEEAIQELRTWPEAQKEALEIINRHEV